jgi:hypothetical protein
MSQLFDNLAALDRKIANRWKIRTRDNVRHVLTAADIDFIFADIIKSARTADITENQGSAIIMLLNASMAANSAKSAAALNRIIHYVDIWQKAVRLNLQPLVGEESSNRFPIFSEMVPSAGSFSKVRARIFPMRRLTTSRSAS